MAKMLGITGITGKSGKILAEKIAENIEDITAKFPDGILAFVRHSSNTKHLDATLPNAHKAVGELKDIAFLEQSLKDVDTLIHIAGIHWSREIVTAAAACGV